MPVNEINSQAVESLSYFQNNQNTSNQNVDQAQNSDTRLQDEAFRVSLSQEARDTQQQEFQNKETQNLRTGAQEELTKPAPENPVQNSTVANEAAARTENQNQVQENIQAVQQNEQQTRGAIKEIDVIA